MRFQNTAMMLAGLIVLSATPASAQQDFSWTGNVAAGNSVEIKGINGAVHAVAASGSQVRVTAVKEAGRRGDVDDVRIEVVQHREGVTICAVYPDRDGRNECAPGSGGRMNVRNNDTKVEFRVEVPQGVNFVGKTVNGTIDVRDITGAVRANTVNGRVDIRTRGVASAQTVNGSINVSMQRADWNGELDFETVNGSIEVAVAQELNTEVRASTVNGSISTDWPLTVQGRFGPKRLNGTIGDGGGRTLSLTTVNGSIELRRGS